MLFTVCIEIQRHRIQQTKGEVNKGILKEELDKIAVSPPFYLFCIWTILSESATSDPRQLVRIMTFRRENEFHCLLHTLNKIIQVYNTQISAKIKSMEYSP
jgi:hypothetical protein